MTLHAHLSPLSIADYLEGELRSMNTWRGAYLPWRVPARRIT